MDINKHLKIKKMLQVEFGEEQLENMVDEISKTIKKNNLDIAPTILKDLFDYIIAVIQISRI